MTMCERLLHVPQGEFAITGEPDIVMTTILGSCVAACIRDPVAGVGGMNHFLLPGGGSDIDSDSLRYGVNAMELLINALLAHGAVRSRLEAKLFGGACVIEGISADVGGRNARFAEQFLRAEGIACKGHSLGGGMGRRLRYWPRSGRAALQLLSPAEAISRPAQATRPGGVEMF